MRIGIVVVTLAALLMAPLTASAQETNVSLGTDPRIAADGVQLSVFADGLDFPMGIVALPDGSMLVGVSAPTDGGFFNSTGSLIRLTDHDADGAADGSGSVLATGIPGPIVAVARGGNLVFVTSASYGQEAIYVYRRGERWADALTQVALIDFAFSGAEHQTYSLLTRPTPGQKGSYDLVFNVGAHGNDA